LTATLLDVGPDAVRKSQRLTTFRTGLHRLSSPFRAPKTLSTADANKKAPARGGKSREQTHADSESAEFFEPSTTSDRLCLRYHQGLHRLLHHRPGKCLLYFHTGDSFFFGKSIVAVTHTGLPARPRRTPVGWSAQNRRRREARHPLPGRCRRDRS